MLNLITKSKIIQFTFLLLSILILTGCETETYMLDSQELKNDASDFQIVTRSYALEAACGPYSRYLNGDIELYACNLDTNECYSVNAEITNSAVQSIQFNNGKKLVISETTPGSLAYLDMYGEGEGRDSNNTSWSFEADTNAALYERAIQEWAKEHDYVIQ